MRAIKTWTGVEHCGSREYESGIDAMFVWNGENGIKFFRYESTAKYAFQWSRIFHAIGFGVKVWDLSCMTVLGKDGKSSEVWFFQCERVQVLKNIHRNSGGDYKLEKRLERIRNKTNQRLVRDHGIEVWDNHLGNWGIIRGRVIPIDLGSFTCNEVFFSQ
jgi:hypothetical protein